MSRTAKLLLAPLFVVQFFFFTFIAWHRFIDGDEGFYLLASRLVIMHKKPYLDFFYTQAPLLPYVYALWMKCFGITWASAKLCSALLTALLGTLLYEEVCHQTRNWLAGLSAVVMFATSALIFGFFPVVKTYSLAGLFLFSTYVLVGRVCATSPRWLIGLAGLLLGLSVDTRSYLLLLTPLFVWWIFRSSDVADRLTSTLWFLGGCVVGVVPCLFFFASSPGAFLFNNLGYHAVRSEGGLIGMWKEKLFALLQVFLGRLEGNGIQTSVLFFISLGFVFSIRKPRYPPQLAFQIAVFLGIVSLLPTPVHPQYFCLCIPFLLLTAVCVVNDLFADLEPGRGKLIAAAACALLVGIYFAASVNDFGRYLVTGDEVAGVESGLKDDFRLQHVLAVSKAIDQVTYPGETVASFWPGYIFQTQAAAFPGLENDFGMPVSDELTPEQRAKYHILSPTEIEADLAAHRPRVVVLHDQILTPTTVEYRQKMRLLEDSFRRSLRADGYTRVRSIGDVSIYICCSGS